MRPWWRLRELFGGSRVRIGKRFSLQGRLTFRGPGTVTFDKASVPVPKQGAMITSSATFSAPGDYLLRVQSNDESGEGGFGFQCCWTNTYVKVTVR